MQALGADAAVAIHTAEENPSFIYIGSLEPVLHRPHRAAGRMSSPGENHLSSFPLLVAFRSPYSRGRASVGKLQISNLKLGELGAPQASGVADERESAISGSRVNLEARGRRVARGPR